MKRCYVVVHSVSKTRNVGNIVRSASAFGAHEVVLVSKSGKRHSMFGAFGSDKHTRFSHFSTLDAAREYLKGEGATIFGIEIAEGAIRVHEHPFSPVSAFIMGNEVRRLQEALCADSL